MREHASNVARVVISYPFDVCAGWAVSRGLSETAGVYISAMARTWVHPWAYFDLSEPGEYWPSEGQISSQIDVCPDALPALDRRPPAVSVGDVTAAIAVFTQVLTPAVIEDAALIVEPLELAEQRPDHTPVHVIGERPSGEMIAVWHDRQMIGAAMMSGKELRWMLGAGGCLVGLDEVGFPAIILGVLPQSDVVAGLQ